MKNLYTKCNESIKKGKVSMGLALFLFLINSILVTIFIYLSMFGIYNIFRLGLLTVLIMFSFYIFAGIFGNVFMEKIFKGKAPTKDFYIIHGVSSVFSSIFCVPAIILAYLSRYLIMYIAILSRISKIMFFIGLISSVIFNIHMYFVKMKIDKEKAIYSITLTYLSEIVFFIIFFRVVFFFM